MTSSRYSLVTALLLLCAIRVASAAGEPTDANRLSMLDVSSKDAPEDIGMTFTSKQVTAVRSEEAAAPGIVVTIDPGAEEYPGVHYQPVEGPWDLSKYGHVRATIANQGEGTITCALRVDAKDKDGTPATNTEVTQIKPGETRDVTVYFGHAYGRKPAADLDTVEIKKVVLFCTKSEQVQKFRIESLVADGAPGELP